MPKVETYKDVIKRMLKNAKPDKVMNAAEKKAARMAEIDRQIKYIDTSRKLKG